MWPNARAEGAFLYLFPTWAAFPIPDGPPDVTWTCIARVVLFVDTLGAE